MHRFFRVVLRCVLQRHKSTLFYDVCERGIALTMGPPGLDGRLRIVTKLAALTSVGVFVIFFFFHWGE